MRIPLILLACLFLFGFGSCEDRPGPAPVPPGPPPKSEDAVLREKIGGLEQQLADALKARDAAIASKDKIGALEASKDAAAAEAALYRQKADELDAYGKTLSKQIRLEREEAAQVKLWIAAALLAVLGGIALGIGLCWQLKRFIIGGVVCFGLAALCLTLAALIPYAIWIGGTVLLVGIATLVVMLVRRHVALDQVAKAIEAVKPAEGTKIVIDDYKQHFNQFLDTASDNIITKIRTNTKKAAAKVKAKALLLKG